MKADRTLWDRSSTMMVLSDVYVLSGLEKITNVLVRSSVVDFWKHDQKICFEFWYKNILRYSNKQKSKIKVYEWIMRFQWQWKRWRWLVALAHQQPINNWEKSRHTISTIREYTDEVCRSICSCHINFVIYFRHERCGAKMKFKHVELRLIIAPRSFSEVCWLRSTMILNCSNVSWKMMKQCSGKNFSMVKILKWCLLLNYQRIYN